MKIFRKLAALALVVLAPTLASATPPPVANLTVLAGRGQRFLLSLDGRPLTGVATQQLHVGWLPPGRHLADVQVYSPYGPPLAFRTVIWLQPGVDSRFALASGPYGAALQPLGNALGGYSGYPAPGGVPYGVSPAAAPAPYGGVPGGGYGTQPGPYGNAPYGGNAYPAPGQPAPGTYPPAAPNGGYDNAPGGYQNAPGPYGNAPGNAPVPGQPDYGSTPGNADPSDNLAPLNADDLGRLTQELQQQPTDEARLDAIRQAFAGNSLQASELSSLLNQLNTEQSRVQLVLLAYEHLADPDNLSLVYQQLRPASVAEVQRSLGLQRTY